MTDIPFKKWETDISKFTWQGGKRIKYKLLLKKQMVWIY